MLATLTRIQAAVSQADAAVHNHVAILRDRGLSWTRIGRACSKSSRHRRPGTLARAPGESYYVFYALDAGRVFGTDAFRTVPVNWAFGAIKTGRVSSARKAAGSSHHPSTFR
jgi:hypothetical protein